MTRRTCCRRWTNSRAFWVGPTSRCALVATTDEPVRLPPALTRSFHRVELDTYSAEELLPLVASIFAGSQLMLAEPLTRQLVHLGRCVPGQVRRLAMEFRDHHLAAPGNVPLTREALMRLAKFDWRIDEHGLEDGDYQLLGALESGPKGLPALRTAATSWRKCDRRPCRALAAADRRDSARPPWARADGVRRAVAAAPRAAGVIHFISSVTLP